MFVEFSPETQKNYFCITQAKGMNNIPLSIHSVIECYAVINGSATAVVDEVEYHLSSGDAMLVFPNQRHEYTASEESEIWICTFSPDMVDGFDVDSRLPLKNVFSFASEVTSPDNTLLKRALCYTICGNFDKSAQYKPKKNVDDDLLSKILSYVSSNFRADCGLDEVAAAVGYDYSYISKFFKRMTKTSFVNYVNSVRISEACRLLSNSDMPVQDVGEACGFGSTRSFNREFLRLIGCSPRDYRDNK